MSTTRIGLEIGSTWVFASAVDWPGWCRRGRGEDAAIATLLEYAGRYGRVAGRGFQVGRSEVIGRVGGNATTDFGAPGARGPWDDEPLHAAEVSRQVGLLQSSWAAFDQADAAAPAVLPKGPRGGGRDRDGIAGTLLEGNVGTTWPPRYFIRRAAWHVLDHAWELEDKSR